ncbi:B- and T-lymphocyte attenuator-like [Mugil cephalus]|uniref:B- and T-lymphocyte attenuator-like n=1 Tax=Mugil cephalus TaxID=48193 RepID=UPI001FB5E69F|nr:B- and T-lymphocyte attenuator-like [Mugil cephalus]
MSSLMDRLSYLVIFLCFTCIRTSGTGEDLISSCEVEIFVRRRTTWFTAPGQSVSLSCPVQHCGERVNITWCKVTNMTCERINKSKNVEIRQNRVGDDQLVSYLRFKEISVSDGGLYRCGLMGKQSPIGHAINISVSDSYESVKTNFNSDNNPAESLSADPGGAAKWVPYFVICFSVILLVATLSLIVMLRFHKWNQKLTCNSTKGKETSTKMIPDLPRWSAHPSPVPQTHLSVPNDIYFSSAAGTPSFAAAAKTQMKGQGSECEVYASIMLRPAGIPHIYPTINTMKQAKGTEYTAVNV